MQTPTPINDHRLTPDMERIRSGSTQLFRVVNDRQFTTEKNADVVLTPPAKHIYAELIDGQWCWVNGCAECNGQPRDWMTYIECEEHNRCRTCGTKRADLKKGEHAWAGKHGWQCGTCETREHEAKKAEALAAMPEEFDEWDYRWSDSIKCPYCNYAIEDTTEYHGAIDSPEEIECERCDNIFKLEGEVEIKWTMSRTA